METIYGTLEQYNRNPSLFEKIETSSDIKYKFIKELDDRERGACSILNQYIKLRDKYATDVDPNELYMDNPGDVNLLIAAMDWQLDRLEMAMRTGLVIPNN